MNITESNLTEKLIEKAKADLNAYGWEVEEVCLGSDLIHLLCTYKCKKCFFEQGLLRKSWGPVPRIEAYSSAYRSITGKGILTLLREE